MIFEDWLSILEACIVPNPVVALPNVLEVAINLTDLAFYFQSPYLKVPLGSNADIKRPLKKER